MPSILKRWRRKPVSNQEQQPASAADTPLEQRTRVADVPYLLPKDAAEDRRLNYQHHVLYKTISNHYLAPLIPGSEQVMLDVGTGTGIWLVEMSALFPTSQFIGIDVALTSLPQLLPSTCIFSKANVLKGLPFPDRQFTFTHQRLMVAAIPAIQWANVVHELVRVTKPGGWIELLEIGDTIQNAGPATKRLLTWMTNISKELGFEMEVLHRLGELLRLAGCQDVDSQDIPVPLGAWAGSVGQMLKTDVLYGYNALKDTYCPRSHTPPSLFDAMVQAAADEWEQKQCSYVFHASYGRRVIP